MTTTVISTVGPTGTYTTIQAWEDAAPVSLVAVDQIWRGECQNDTFTAGVTFSGSTSDSTRYKILTTVAGASFLDHATAASNRLSFDNTKGANLAFSGSYSAAFTIDDSFARVEKLQVKASDNTSKPFLGAGSSVKIDNCILWGRASRLDGGPVVTNTLLDGATHTGTQLFIASDGTFINCTFVRPTDGPALSQFVSGNYGALNFKNCALFGAGALTSGSSTRTYTNCVTDVASPPSGCTTTTYNTGSAFANVLAATADFKLTSGSTLINAGTATGAPTTDIIGTARPQGASYDVGAWEFAAAGGVVFNDSVTEAAIGADTGTRLAVVQASAAEAGSGADAQAVQASFSVGQPEPASGTDTTTAQAGFQSAVTESASAADATATMGASFAVTVAEVAGAVEAETAQTAFLSVASETATGTDAQAAQAALNVVGTDSGALAEAASVNAVWAVAKIEIGGLVDVTDGTIGSAVRSDSVTEAATATDVTTVVATLNATQLESGAVADSGAAMVQLATAATETAVGADSGLAVRLVVSTMAEAGAGADAASVLLSFAGATFEISTATDSFAVRWSYNDSILEVANLQDAWVGNVSYVRQALQYPLTGVPQVYPSLVSQPYVLSGLQQTYPLTGGGH